MTDRIEISLGARLDLYTAVCAERDDQKKARRECWMEAEAEVVMWKRRADKAESALKTIDALMVRRIKHHQDMKNLKGSGAAQKREHYKLHALSEALGEIRKVTKEGFYD